MKEDNPNTVPSTVAKDIKKSDEKVEFSHPVKSSIIRNPSHTRIPCSKSKMSLSWNKASCVIQLHGMWQHHLQGGGVGGLHVLWCLQSELQTQIQKRKGRRSVEESNREQGGFHSSNFRDRTACFSMTEIIQRVLKCIEYRREWTCRYDDQSDYFDLNDRWSGKKMDPNAYKPVYEQRSKVMIPSVDDK